MAKATKNNQQGPPPAADGGKVFPTTQTGGAPGTQVQPSGSGVMRAPEQTAQQFIINQIVMRSVDRTPKDIGRWRTDHKAAENIYYPNRSRLYDLYADVLLDGHLMGIIEKRIKTTTNKTIRFVKNKKEDATFKPLIESIAFNDMLFEALLSKAWGITGFEFLPGDAFCPKPIPRKHIKPEKGVIAINQTDYDGIPYSDIPNIWVIGKQRDLGYLLPAAFYVLLKKGTFSDWANYVEIFGQPLMVTKYDTFDEKTKAQLTTMMENAGSSLRISIPKQADFEIMDGKTSNGNGDLQDKFVEACDKQLSILVLGNTETTSSSKSSGYAQSQTMQKEQSEIIKDDLKFIRNLLNSKKFKDICDSYGYNTDGGEFVIEESTSVNDLLVRSQIDIALKTQGGLPIDDEYLYDTYNIPKPANYDELKAKQDIEEEDAEPAQPDPGQKPAPTKPAPGNKNPATASLTAVDRALIKIANFFDPARKG